MNAIACDFQNSSLSSKDCWDPQCSAEPPDNHSRGYLWALNEIITCVLCFKSPQECCGRFLPKHTPTTKPLLPGVELACSPIPLIPPLLPMPTLNPSASFACFDSKLYSFHPLFYLFCFTLGQAATQSLTGNCNCQQVSSSLVHNIVLIPRSCQPTDPFCVSSRLNFFFSTNLIGLNINFPVSRTLNTLFHNIFKIKKWNLSHGLYGSTWTGPWLSYNFIFHYCFLVSDVVTWTFYCSWNTTPEIHIAKFAL
jgi:hypothetical protein